GGTYALGIIPRYLSDGRMVYEHNGTLTGWNAQLVIEPISGNGIAVVSNSGKKPDKTSLFLENKLHKNGNEYFCIFPFPDSGCYFFLY
ncbi:MAG: hypothetical protein MR531_01995, partial [Lachnospiraceae bacterium]|nr:hypothetical protein [Lachnospiraceae bacterium]